MKTGQTDAVTCCGYDRWIPQAYLQEYYTRDVQPDDRVTLSYQIDFLGISQTKFERAIEFGCGPTLLRAIAAAPYVRQLDMADYLESNLQVVKRWIDNEPQGPVDDWTPFTKFVLEQEGKKAGRASISEREMMTRHIIRNLLVCDATETFPLGISRCASYDLLVTGFCIECISGEVEVWRQCIANVFRLLRPGGSFVLAALCGCEQYRVGQAWFPASKIRHSDLQKALCESGCDPLSLDIRKQCTDVNIQQGWHEILLASGRTLDSR